MDKQHLLPVIKAIKLLNYKADEKIISSYLKKQISYQNACLLYVLSRKFNLVTLSQHAYWYIGQFYTAVIKSENFLKLDFRYAAEIFDNQKLRISSELEVFYAAERWVNYDEEERCQNAVSLLNLVRLPLLSVKVLSGLLSEKFTLSSLSDCKTLIQTALSNRSKNSSKVINTCYESRYCEEEDFDVLVFETDTKRNHRIIKFDCGDLSKPTEITALLKPRQKPFSAVIDGILYVFGGFTVEGGYLPLIESYSPITKKWENFAFMPVYNEIYYSCTFMSKIYIFGAKLDKSNLFSVFDPETRIWSEKTSANRFSHSSAGAVFKGSIIISGGHEFPRNVELYDHYADEWYFMPSTLQRREGHAMVSVRNKLHIIGDFKTEIAIGEVFDNLNFCFTLTKPFLSLGMKDNGLRYRTLAIGSKILVFNIYTSKHSCYDIDTEEWSYIEDLYLDISLSCVKTIKL